MQEEVTQCTVALCVEATKLSAGMLQQAIKKVLREIQKSAAVRKTRLHHGKRTLRQLHQPDIGDMKVQDITPQVVDKYIQTLQKTPAANTKTHHAKTKLVTNAAIEKIIKLLHCAFKQVVRWELVSKNSFDNVVLPKVVFHSLRHSGAAYRLKLNHGDLKATQSDTGHAQIDMIPGVYTHILDESRKINAQKAESDFLCQL